MPTRNFCDCCDELIKAGHGSIEIERVSWDNTIPALKHSMVCKRCLSRIADAIKALGDKAKEQ